jgi:beta-phosphoglucomutase-like phosphatase (HAD superfamily)
MANFTTLIFDFDGTLGDTLIPHIELFKKIAKEENISFEEDVDIEAHRKLSAKDLIKKYKLNPIQLTRFIKKTHQELNKTFDQLEMFPGIEDLLRYLAKNYRLGISIVNSSIGSDLTPSISL